MLFAPVEDLGTPDSGFTRKVRDVLATTSPDPGMLRNHIQANDHCPPWSLVAAHLMRNLAGRVLL